MRDGEGRYITGNERNEKGKSSFVMRVSYWNSPRLTWKVK